MPDQAPWERSAGRRRSRPTPDPTLSARALAALGVVAVATAASAVIGLARTTGSDVETGRGSVPGRTSGTTSPAAKAVATLPDELVSWLRAALPADAVVLADLTAAQSLQDAGVRAVTPAQADRVRVRFVLSTEALPGAAARYPAAAAALRRSIAVAIVAGRGTRIAVRQVTTATPAEFSADARTRRSAERQLLANPAVRTGSDAADVLRAGDLDLRAATVLALLAASGPVELVRVVAVPAECAAGRPARTVDVRTTMPGLAAQLRSVASEYRLEDITRRTDGTYRLTWPLDITPVAQLR